MSDEGNWYDGLEHAELTTNEARTVLSEYKNQEAFNVAGLNAKRKVGAPFRFPKSVESLPDDAVRADFATQVAKFHGERAYDEKQLDGVNYAEGLADARTVNDKLKGVLVDFAKKTKMPVAQVQELASAYNAFSTEFLNEHNATQAKEKTDTAAKVNETLKALFGGDDGVKINSDNVRKMFKDHAGLTPEEYEQSAVGLIESGITRDAVLSKALFNLAKQYAESTTEITETGGKKEQTETQEIKEQMSETAKVLGW